MGPEARLVLVDISQDKYNHTSLVTQYRNGSRPLSASIWQDLLDRLDRADLVTPDKFLCPPEQYTQVRTAAGVCRDLLSAMTNKKSVNQRKAEARAVNEVYAESMKMKDRLELSVQQWGVLFGVGILTATIPCGLFFTAVYSIPSETLTKSMMYFGVGVLLTGLVMTMNYNRMSTKERTRLITALELAGGADSGKQIQGAFVESASFAVMISNAWYFLAYFFFVYYALPSYQLNDASNFFIGSVGSSLTIFLLSSKFLLGNKIEARQFLSKYI